MIVPGQTISPFEEATKYELSLLTRAEEMIERVVSPTSASIGRGTTASTVRHLRRAQDPREPSHPGIPNSQAGARRTRSLKFPISLARIMKGQSKRDFMLAAGTIAVTGA